MTLDASQWSLFGYDLRRFGHYFVGGWRDFLWGQHSPVLSAIDEIVRVTRSDGTTSFYRGGQPVSIEGQGDDVVAQAVMLPDALVLSKQLKFPAAVEHELEAAVAMEVTTSSPFARDDTCYGYTLATRGDDTLTVSLAISSQSAVMAHIAGEMNSHELQAYEVWADVNDGVVVLQGFGEQARKQRNRRRMGQLGLLGLYCVFAILAIFAVAAGGKYLQLQRVESMQREAQSAAAQALVEREQFAAAKGMIIAAHELRASLPAPHHELKRLTTLLGDDTWLSVVDIKGRQIRIEGESTDAAAVMQLLLNDPAYSRVESPVAFRKARGGAERFVLSLTLAGGDPS